MGYLPTNVIYEPRGQAFEYSALATNPYRGCGHGCRYCYVPSVLRCDRKVFDEGAFPRSRFLEAFDKAVCKLPANSPQIMLSFTTDPYHPGETELTCDVIKSIIRNGQSFCVLTKGGTRAIRDADLYREDRDCFASTLTSLDDKVSKKWEPNAALPKDRIAALKYFHDLGVFTWVSLEPTIDVEESLSIISYTNSFVDLYKIGRANYLPMTKTTDWAYYTNRVITLLSKLKKAHYIKRDLQKYLPTGYSNSLRVIQHN